MATVAEEFIANLESADTYDTPYRHWILSKVLPDDICRDMDALDVPMSPALDYEGGRREANNSSRAFFDTARQAENPSVAAVAQALKAPETIAAIERITGADLAGSLLRIEYCQDGDGFWLEPHTDIGAKLFTMLIYLSVGEGSDNCGTDVFDDDKNLIKTAPFAFNSAMVFVPGTNTWHGFNRRRINGTRKSIIVNYVKPEWRSRHELAFDEPVK